MRTSLHLFALLPLLLPVLATPIPFADDTADVTLRDAVARDIDPGIGIFGSRDDHDVTFDPLMESESDLVARVEAYFSTLSEVDMSPALAQKVESEDEEWNYGKRAPVSPFATTSSSEAAAKFMAEFQAIAESAQSKGTTATQVTSGNGGVPHNHNQRLPFGQSYGRGMGSSRSLVAGSASKPVGGRDLDKKATSASDSAIAALLKALKDLIAAKAASPPAVSSVNAAIASLSNGQLSSNAQLSNAQLSNGQLSNAQLSNAQLSNAQLSNGPASTSTADHGRPTLDSTPALSGF